MDMPGAGQYAGLAIRDAQRLECEWTLAGDGSSDVGVVLRCCG